MAGQNFYQCNVPQMSGKQARYVPPRDITVQKRHVAAQISKHGQQQRVPAWASRLSNARDSALAEIFLYYALVQTLEDMKKLEAERPAEVQVPLQQREWTEEELAIWRSQPTAAKSELASPIGTTTANSTIGSSPASSSALLHQQSSIPFITSLSPAITAAKQIQPAQQEQAIAVYQPAPFAGLFAFPSSTGQQAVAAVAETTRCIIRGSPSSANRFLVFDSSSLVVPAAVPIISLISVLCSDIMPSSLVPGYRQQQQASRQMSIIGTRRCFILPLSAIVWVLQKRAARRSRRALLKAPPVSTAALPDSSTTPLVSSAKPGKPNLSITIPDLVLNTPCATPTPLPCLDLFPEEGCVGAVIVEIVVQGNQHCMPDNKAAPIKAAPALASSANPRLSHTFSESFDDSTAEREGSTLQVQPMLQPLKRLLSAVGKRRGGRSSTPKASDKSKTVIKAMQQKLSSKLQRLVRSCSVAFSCSSRAPAVLHE